ncbi:MAG: hypothetical protein KGI52_17635 [Burkholderiales bacterium]|nr:hypothetical protein [Burkholderiales bacterium]
MTYPPRNLERIKAILDHIEAHPETWNQRNWHCGTTHCFAGHAQLAAGMLANDKTVRADAREWLSLTRAEADYYFARARTLDQLRELLVPLDADGYDHSGFNRAGFNRDGHNGDGYDRGGYDHSGFNRAGFNREGYDRAGYDRDGYDRNGYDRDGFGRDGFNRSIKDQA